MVGEHLLDVGCATAAAMAGRRCRSGGDLTQRARAFADGALDRLVFDVVAAADRLEAAERRMQRLVVVFIHYGRG